MGGCVRRSEQIQRVVANDVHKTSMSNGSFNEVFAELVRLFGLYFDLSGVTKILMCLSLFVISSLNPFSAISSM
jgi:hypothetical protein